MNKTTSDRFSRLVAWRLFESTSTVWSVMGNVAACGCFAWAMVLTVCSMTTPGADPSTAYLDAFSCLLIAAVAYYSAMVAKAVAALAKARQIQIGNQASKGPSRVDLFIMLGVGIAGAVKAPAIFEFCDSNAVGILATGLLMLACCVVLAVLPTAFRMSGPQPQR